MLKLSKIISEIKNISKFPFEKGKFYDIKLWYDGMSFGEDEDFSDAYEPYPGTIAGEEGWYWSKDWKFVDLKNGKWVFEDMRDSGPSSVYMEFPIGELKNSDIRPHKNLYEIKNISGNGKIIVRTTNTPNVFTIVSPIYFQDKLWMANDSYNGNLFFVKIKMEYWYVPEGKQFLKEFSEFLDKNGIEYKPEKGITLNKKYITVLDAQ